MSRQLAGLINTLAKALPKDKFLAEFNATLLKNCNDESTEGFFRPSSLGSCLRTNYYMVKPGVKAEPEKRDAALQDICDSGTDRHTRIQTTITKMKDAGFNCEWINVEEFLNQRPVEGTEVVEHRGDMETRCRNTNYNIYFSCDGIIRYDNVYYVLEVKTESTFKFSNHDTPHEEHMVQATTYALCLGLGKVMFLYENRDLCNKKVMIVDVTDEMKTALVLDRISEVNKHLADGTLPAKSIIKKHCNYCRYKKQCKIDGQ